jgi:hypothetical protein
MPSIKPNPLRAVLCVLCLLCGSAAAQIQKPATITGSDWGSKPQPIPDDRRHTPKFVTLHHAGVIWKGDRTPIQFIRNMQVWGQNEKNWPDLPYHFLIAPDGNIYEGRSLDFEPESNTKYPLAGNIGVEMMGHFGEQRPSPEQLASAARLTAWLCQEYNIAPTRANIRGHKDAAPGQTSCPGEDFQRYLDDGQFIAWVKGFLAGKEVKIEPGPPLPNGPTAPIPTATTRPS